MKLASLPRPNDLPSDITASLSRAWTVEEAFAYCSALTKAHYENFPVGSLLMPQRLQPAIHSLYAFMRTADDFSDENRKPGDGQERVGYLNTWDQMLSDCVAGKAQHPIFIALKVTLDQYQLPVQWLRDLLAAFKMDCMVNRYQTFAELETYCRYSAHPVGRLILTLCGYRSEELYRLSDAICTGLQLANHWQDVSVDAQKNRIYLPQEDLKQFGLADVDLLKGHDSPASQKLVAYQVDRARGFFQTGRPLPERVQGRLKYELRLTWHGGMRILDKIQHANYQVLNHRPVVSKFDWLSLGFKTLLGT